MALDGLAHPERRYAHRVLWLVLLLIVAPMVELYVILQVAQQIGGWETLVLLLVESAIGAWLLKRQGLAALRHMQEAMAAGRPPRSELVDGLLILVAGALMLAPGFVGDLVAFLLLIPPTRALLRRPLLRRLERGGFATAGSASSGPRFVGTFWAGGAYEATGREASPEPRPPLGS